MLIVYFLSLTLTLNHGTPLQHSCLENPMDGGTWQAAVRGVAKSRTRLSDFTFTHWRRKWQPTPVFLPGESQGRGSLMGCRLWGRTESGTTEATQQQQFLIRSLALPSALMQCPNIPPKLPSKINHYLKLLLPLCYCKFLAFFPFKISYFKIPLPF